LAGVASIDAAPPAGMAPFKQAFVEPHSPDIAAFAERAHSAKKEAPSGATPWKKQLGWGPGDKPPLSQVGHEGRAVTASGGRLAPSGSLHTKQSAEAAVGGEEVGPGGSGGRGRERAGPAAP
jgi:hypothetical protein